MTRTRPTRGGSSFGRWLAPGEPRAASLGRQRQASGVKRGGRGGRCLVGNHTRTMS